MGAIEQDIIKRFINGEEIKPPKRLRKMPNAHQKKVIVWDADNTFWDWTRNRATGVNNMSEVTGALVKADVDEVRRSFGRVFDAADTFDHPEILEYSDLVIHKLMAIAHSWRNNPDLGIIKMIRATIHLAAANIKAYHADRKNQYGLYAYMRETLSALHMYEQMIGDTRERVFDQIVVTNAPEDKVTSRSKHFRIGRFFSKFFTQPPASVKYDEAVENGKIKYAKEGERHKPVHKQYKEIIKGIIEVDKHSAPSKYEGVMSTLQLYSTDYDIQPLDDQHKPLLVLSDLLQMTEKQVREQVVVVGDGESDILLAVQNNCEAIRAEWGVASDENKKILKQFGSESERRNVPDEEAIERLKRRASRNKKNIHEAHSPIQVLDLLGVPRPPFADVIPALHTINNLLANTEVNRYFISKILESAKQSQTFQQAQTEGDYAKAYDEIIRGSEVFIRQLAKSMK